MVKDHSDSEKGNPLPPPRLLHPRIAHTTTFVTPVVEHWLEREITSQVKWKTFLVMTLNSQHLNF